MNGESTLIVKTTSMRNFLYACLMTLPFTSCFGQTQSVTNGLTASDISSDTQRKAIHNIIKDFPNNTQVSIGVFHKASETFYDIKKENDTIRLIEHEPYVYEIGSITKVFTATLLAQAVLEEKIDLNDAVNDQFDYPFHTGITLSYKQLANHTSGLFRLPSNLYGGEGFVLANPYKVYSNGSLQQYLENELKLDEAARSSYSYSNLGAGILGQALARGYDTSYKHLVQTKIFNAFTMQHSTFGSETVTGFLVEGLNQTGEVVPFWDMDAMAPAGAALSTTEDLLSFARLHITGDNEALNFSRKRTATANKNLDVALGWHIVTSKTNTEYHWHNGGTGGFRSSLAIDMQDGNAVVILSNVAGSSAKSGQIDTLCFKLLDLLKDE